MHLDLDLSRSKVKRPVIGQDFKIKSGFGLSNKLLMYPFEFLWFLANDRPFINPSGLAGTQIRAF